MEKVRKKRKVFLLLAAVFAAAGLFCGCSIDVSGNLTIKDAEKDTTVVHEVNFFGYKTENGLNLATIEMALRDFMADNTGYSVLYEGVKHEEYWKALDRRSNSDRLDDIFMIDRDSYNAMRAEDKLEDITDCVDTSVLSLDIIEQMMDPRDGKIYFLPAGLVPYGLFVNKKMLSDHNMEEPKDLGGFTAVCDYFVSQGITPIIVNDYSALRVLMVAVGLYPVYAMDNAKQVLESFNSAPATIYSFLERGLEFVNTMIQRGWIDCREAQSTKIASDDIALFAAGDRPFMITGGWLSYRVRNAAPGLNYEVCPFPVLEDGAVLVTKLDTCLAVNNTTVNMDVAKGLIKRMSQPSYLSTYAKSQSSFSLLNNENSESDSTIKKCTPYLTNGRMVPCSDMRLRVPVDTYLMECGSMLMNGSTLAEAKTFLNDVLSAEVAR